MDLHPITGLSICSGIGGLDHGLSAALDGKLCNLVMVEREAFSCSNLVAQMEEGAMAPAPIWSDAKQITSTKGSAYIRRALGGERLDIIYGGIPCQPWSVSGKQDGAGDDRDLWPATLAAIRKFQPGAVFIENVGGFADKPLGLRRTAGDLRELGYAVAAGIFSSSETEGTHERKRCFILGLAHTEVCTDFTQQEWREGKIAAAEEDWTEHASGGLFARAGGKVADGGNGQLSQQRRRQDPRNGAGSGGADRVANSKRSRWQETGTGAREHSETEPEERSALVDDNTGKRERRLAGEERTAIPNTARRSGAVANSGSESAERKGNAPIMGRAQGPVVGTADKWQRTWRTFGHIDPALASPPGKSDDADWLLVAEINPAFLPSINHYSLSNIARGHVTRSAADDLDQTPAHGWEIREEVKLEICRLANEDRYRNHILSAVGNAVDAQVAALAWKVLWSSIQVGKEML